jgi:predicted nucleotidyltransferase
MDSLINVGFLSYKVQSSRVINMHSSRFSEGDYIRTVEGLFFAVKGGRHSNDLVLGVLRYIPDKRGERVYLGKSYHRVYDLELSTKYLKKYHPLYINYIDWLGLMLQSVPISQIAEVYKPTEHLKRILTNPGSKLEIKVARFVKALSNSSGVSLSSFGISGSLLIGLERDNSDIDLNVYGEKEGRRVYEALKELRDSEDWISAYDKDSIEQILVSRWGDTGLELDQFRRIECEKVLHGLVGNIDYFIRLLVDEKESTSIPVGKVTIHASITDTTLSIYTPCVYRVKDVFFDDKLIEYTIKKLKSYRGKFTEQVTIGQRIKAYGTLERVNSNNEICYRLILGGKGDYLIPVLY